LIAGDGIAIIANFWTGLSAGQHIHLYATARPSVCLSGVTRVL